MRGARSVSRRVTVALVGVVVLALAGCSADDTGPDIPQDGAGSLTTSSDPASASASVSASPTPSAVDGVPLTAQGTALTVGQTATVSYQPRQGETGVLDVTVTALEQTSFKKSFVGWNISTQDQQSKPYFVRATVTNRGTVDLGKRPVPLYIVDATNTLVEATTFASTFKPCQPGHFPTSFPTGASTEVCLVYLAPSQGDLTAVSFRPSQDFNPITWTGDLQQAKATGAKKGKKNKAGGSASASPSESSSG